MSRLSGILLAAGAGRRFGSNKLLHPLEDGTPLVLRAARTLLAALPHTLAVVNPADSEVIDLLEKEGVAVVPNPDAQAGMGSSIARGVQASCEADGWVIALADMPFLQTRTILSVEAGIRQSDSICAPRYGDRRGHPVGFGRAYAGLLMQLDGDEGARHIVAANRENLALFETADRGAVADIDYPQDIAPSAG
jgi:molybdenum cofactor cytidylyltransferase